jgi:hypothetical protein
VSALPRDIAGDTGATAPSSPEPPARDTGSDRTATAPHAPPRQPKGPRRWPLLLIGSSAFVAIWSGWVSLGGMCGFGTVTPLPGIIGGFRLDMAITLPLSMESYGWYAIGAWLSPLTPRRARGFAAWSSLAALALGASGQVAYHLLVAAHRTAAPWPVTVVVSCIPVAAIGMGATLAHLLRDAGDDSGDPPEGDSPGDTAGDSDSDTGALPGQDGSAARRDSGEAAPADRKPAARPTAPRKPDLVAAAIRRGWDDDKIIARHGVTKRTIQRRRKELAEAANSAAE